MKLIFISLLLIGSFACLKARECKTDYDPFITTFDGMRYGFQYSGDHFIMYDDFRGTRVTSGFQQCGAGSCNCAMYLKKDTKLMFVDFCNVDNNKSPTSRIYGVSVEKNFIGPKAIRQTQQCPVISPNRENDEATWKRLPTILGKFKCARLQGSSHFTTYVLRTIEPTFAETLKIKFQLATRAMPTLSITAPQTAYGHSGGLCGRWDGSTKTDLYILDKDGVEKFLSTSNLGTVRDYWHLNSVYNKESSYTKRCPECMLMAERSYYCPCDKFDMFDDTNYNLNPSNRTNYCKVPMYKCVEKHFNFHDPKPTTQMPTTTLPTVTGWDNTTNITTPMTTTSPSTLPPIDPDTAQQLCWEAFLNNTGLAAALETGCLDANSTIQFCVDDVSLTNDPEFINIHIQSAIDLTIQNILTNQTNCDDGDLQLFCPNGCSNNGVCQFRPECLLAGEIFENCSYPIQCVCNHPYGGPDCSQDLTNIPDLSLDRQCCDLRTEDCGSINGFGYPFSTRDPIHVKVEYTEYDLNGNPHVVTETSLATTYTENNIQINLSQLESLNLYKSINNIPSNFTSKDALAYVRIFISYTDTKFIQSSRMTLYDSKCRECDQETGSINQLEETCEIDGVCYNRNETYTFNDLFYCNPDNSNNTWTVKPTPDPLCNGDNEWTDWFNYDDPDGDGDLELYIYFKYGCKNPSYVQVQTVDGVPANQTGQIVHIAHEFGFMCLNSENQPMCLDYQIRQCCPSAQMTTTRTTSWVQETTVGSNSTDITDGGNFNFTTTATWVNQTTELATTQDDFNSSTTSANANLTESATTEGELYFTTTKPWLNETTESGNWTEPATTTATFTGNANFTESATTEGELYFTTTKPWLNETTESGNWTEPATTTATFTGNANFTESATTEGELYFTTTKPWLNETTESGNWTEPATTTATTTDSTTASTTTTTTLSTTTTTTSTLPTTTIRYPCKGYSLDFGGVQNMLAFTEKSNRSTETITFKLVSNDTNCIFEGYVGFHIKSADRTAQSKDYTPIDEYVSLNPNKTSQTISFDLLYDNLVEPYEFFTLHLSNVSSNIQYVYDRIFVYIIDNDYGSGAIDTDIYNVFRPDIAKPDFYAAYYKDQNYNDVFTLPNNQAMFTSQGGFSVPQQSVNIVVQYLGIEYYRLHTVEIHNQDKCNILEFSVRRKDLRGNYLDPYELYSILVDGVPLVDIDFYKYAFNLPDNGDVLDYMDVKVKRTKNGSNISSCEFRAFADAQ